MDDCGTLSCTRGFCKWFQASCIFFLSPSFGYTRFLITARKGVQEASYVMMAGSRAAVISLDERKKERQTICAASIL